MPIDYHHLKNRQFAPVRQTYTERDSMLYALSLGLGQDPLDAQSLPFVYEGAPGGAQALPTQSAVLGYPGFWVREPDTGIDWMKLLHGEQRMTMHRPLPAAGTVVGHNRVIKVIDKGQGKGAIIVVERRVVDEAGVALATSEQVVFCRGDGGYSQIGSGQPSDEPLAALQPTPADRQPDEVVVQPTRPESALLYRLLADPNPIHADPQLAQAAGFARPILHGLATYAMVGWSVLRHCADGDAKRLRSLNARFAAPVYPGETLSTSFWREAGGVRFNTRVVERDTVVLTHGWAALGG